MTFFSILETLLIGPLKLIFEIIFELAHRFIGHPGTAIIVLSLIMNILVLPLYKRADAMQEESRDIEAKLRDGVAHIKKTFSGDERMMILQAYYRQNNYKPTDALNGSVSLLLEIPFFMAAYQFLSHLEILDGVSLGPIKNLGAPDGLLVIGGIAINVLPILMTLINVISSAIYLKGFPLKTKIQLYAMALFFLVFLYSSPSCLVFYWTLNNLFSLVKTIFYKIKNPQKVLRILTSLIGVMFVALGFVYNTDSLKRKVFLFAVGVVLQLPALLPLLKTKVHLIKAPQQPNRKLFLMGSVFLTVLIGLLIPSTFIAASPQEYVDLTYFHNPLWYVVNSLCLAAGAFLVWMRVFYWLASPNGKVIFDKLVWVLCGVTIVNYMFFGTDLGIISSILQYENGIAFSRTEQLVNLLVIFAVIAVLYFFVCKWKKVVATILVTAIVAVGCMSALNVVTIKNSISALSSQQAMKEQGIPHFQLSKTGQNVVVLMLDRAMNEYIPYFFNEKPELKEKFAGFTYYDNTLSFGAYTNFGTPALLGGYEYTPVELNKRKTESLASKHNEALKVMPTIFANNNYDVTVCDPVYANYQWIPDLTIFDDNPAIKTYITKGTFSDVNQKAAIIENNRRNFFCFSVMKSMPLFLQPTIYNNGRYNQAASNLKNPSYSTQTVNDLSTSTGLFAPFMESYNALASMSSMTKITDDKSNTFLLMTSDLTHEPMLLQVPEYAPAQKVDNTEFDAANTDRFIYNGKPLKVENTQQMIHYQTNMAALIQLAKWFDYLRENDVYDNTRIILVADHGRNLGHFEEMIVNDGKEGIKNLENYYPLLMVKDFNSKEFSTSSEFMTNADVPTLATKDLIEAPKNPFTNKAINSDEKTAHDQFVIMSYDWDVEENNGNIFLPAKWACVKDDMRIKSNWKFFDKATVLDEHSAPE